MNTLIDRAIKKAGSVKKLAELVGMPANVVSMLRHGDRTITPETAAELAGVLGEDAGDAAIEAMMLRAEGTRRGEQLIKILNDSLMLRRSKRKFLSYCVQIEPSVSEGATFFPSLISPQAGPLFTTAKTHQGNIGAM